MDGPSADWSHANRPRPEKPSESLSFSHSEAIFVATKGTRPGQLQRDGRDRQRSKEKHMRHLRFMGLGAMVVVQALGCGAPAEEDEGAVGEVSLAVTTVPSSV